MNELTKAVAQNVRRARRRSGLSLSELARRAHISTTTLSGLESGDGNPTVDTVWSLAQALDLPVADLIQVAEIDVGARVVRSGDGVVLQGQTLDVRLLSQASGVGRLEFLRADIKAGPSRNSSPHATGTVEHIFVREGSVHVGPEDSPAHLTDGDYATFPGDIPHVYEATTPHADVLIIICYPPTALS